MTNTIERVIDTIGQSATEVVVGYIHGKPIPRRSFLVGTLPAFLLACSGQKDYRHQEEDGIAKIEIHLPQGLRQPETGEFIYTFKERSLAERPQRLEDLVKNPLRIKMVIDARNIPLLGFKGGIGRSDEPMTRIAWETTIRDVDPNNPNIFRLTWNRWKFQGATWNDNDLPVKIQQSTV